jgi:N-acetylmuramoyl-L-alanine amidase
LLRYGVVVGLLSTVMSGGAAMADPPRRLEIDLGRPESLWWSRGETPVLRVRPRRGDGWINISRRYTGRSDAVRRLQRANPGLENPLRDRSLRVPVEMLRADLRLTVVRALFPADQRVGIGWQHWVLDPFGGGEESWEWLAELFTGNPGTARELRRANPELAESGLLRARPMLIPEAKLLRVFRSVEARATAIPRRTATPRPTPTSPPIRPTATAAVQLRPSPRLEAAGVLEYGSDRSGDFAIYHLRRGEALYSAVVVRFTGQLLAVDVNATARLIARRSGISDVTAIPVGFPIKIPLDLLLPEHLPRDHPRRAAWQREQRELAQFVQKVRAVDLSGVHVILDAGHGGRDTGAIVGGVWESTYAYDIMCRIKENLERHTRATVWVTIRDTRRSYSIPATDRLEQHREQVLLTRPPYTLQDSSVGVHLRWYLTNDIILRRLEKGVPRAKTIFLSVHADSLHSSVRGSMVYVPSRYLRPDRFSVGKKAMRRFAEYKNNPTVRLDDEFKARAEASSRRLARHLLSAIGEEGLAVHPYEPIRDRVLRGKRSWVPAVLRYSLAQNAVLLECSNMANVEDRSQMLDAEWRERFARSVVAGMASAFDG